MKKDSLEKKIAAYVTLAAAYLAAHPVDADAQILYTDVNPDVIIDNGYFNLDLNNDGVTDFKLQNSHSVSPPFTYTYSGYTYFHSCEYSHGLAKVVAINPLNRMMGNCNSATSWGGYSVQLARALNAGEVVNGQQPFVSANVLRWHNWHQCTFSSTYMGDWGEESSAGCITGLNKIIGVKVYQNGIAHYGWLRLNVWIDYIITLKDYAINLTPGGGIQAGVIPTCPKPVNLSSVSINNHSQKLLWTIQGTSIGYQVRIRQTGTTSWTTIPVNGNIGFKQIYGLTPNTTYDWQVRSFCSLSPLVQSVFTNTLTFTTPVRMEDEVVDAGATEIQNELFIYPNPAGNEIHLLIGNEGNYEIKIYNMLGQVVSDEKINLAADQIVTINTSQLSAGPYQIVATSNEGNIIGRFVKE